MESLGVEPTVSSGSRKVLGVEPNRVLGRTSVPTGMWNPVLEATWYEVNPVFRNPEPSPFEPVSTRLTSTGGTQYRRNRFWEGLGRTGQDEPLQTRLPVEPTVPKRASSEVARPQRHRFGDNLDSGRDDRTSCHEETETVSAEETETTTDEGGLSALFDENPNPHPENE